MAELSALQGHIEECPRQFGTPANAKQHELGIDCDVHLKNTVVAIDYFFYV